MHHHMIMHVIFAKPSFGYEEFLMSAELGGRLTKNRLILKLSPAFFSFLLLSFFFFLLLFCPAFPLFSLYFTVFQCSKYLKCARSQEFKDL